MDINEIRKEKTNLEAGIAYLLHGFMERTGLDITHVHVSTIDVTSVGSEKRRALCGVSVITQI